MCTVTYITRNDGTCMLTMGRDELVRRDLTTPPIEKKINGVLQIFPYDPVSAGTWIGMTDSSRIACVMNGGKKRHKAGHSFRYNNGRIIPAYFDYNDFNSFYQKYDFDNHSPFTMIALENGKLIELFRDLDSMNFHLLDPGISRIYSSINLFPDKQILERTLKFDRWLKSGSAQTAEDVLNMHDAFRVDKDGPILVKGDKDLLRTVSITMVSKTESQSEMIYHDLINDFRFMKVLKFNKTNITG
jgi:hypothetical protein